jgi:hypothetical protein
VKTLIRVITAAAICLTAQSAFSQTGFGSPDCGQWLAEKTTYRKAWLTGYLSGLNTAHYAINKRDPLDLLSSMDQAFAWMDNYCRKNPLERVSSGGFELFVELLKREAKSK